MNSGDTAWVLISAALVFIMTPAVALFYGGMVRSKNVLSTIMQAMFILGMVSVEFILIGYTMAFGADVNGLIGDLSKVGLEGVGYNLLDGGTIPPRSMRFVRDVRQARDRLEAVGRGGTGRGPF